MLVCSAVAALAALVALPSTSAQQLQDDGCLFITGSTLCPKFQQAYVVPQSLSSTYSFFRNVYDVQDFDKLGLRYINSGFAKDVLQQNLSCSNAPSDTTVRYQRTVLCGMWTGNAAALQCATTYAGTTDSYPKICSSTCDDFHQSESDIASNSSLCSGGDTSQVDNDYSACTNVAGQDTSTCITGDMNEHHCGYANSTEQICAFCAETPGQCCTEPSFDISGMCGLDAAGLSSSAAAATGTASGKSDKSKSGSGKKGLSGGAIAGIVVGVVVGVALIAAILAFFLMRRKRQNKSNGRHVLMGSPGAEKSDNWSPPTSAANRAGKPLGSPIADTHNRTLSNVEAPGSTGGTNGHGHLGAGAGAAGAAAVAGAGAAAGLHHHHKARDANAPTTAMPHGEGATLPGSSGHLSHDVGTPGNVTGGPHGSAVPGVSGSSSTTHGTQHGMGAGAAAGAASLAAAGAGAAAAKQRRDPPSPPSKGNPTTTAMPTAHPATTPSAAQFPNPPSSSGAASGQAFSAMPGQAVPPVGGTTSYNKFGDGPSAAGDNMAGVGSVSGANMAGVGAGAGAGALGAGAAGASDSARLSRVQDSAGNWITEGDQVIVQHPYTATLEDELTLEPGMHILTQELYDDGWARGAVSSGGDPSQLGKVGQFPTVCVAKA